jgi:delta8-fatty-acid desaturase
MTHPAPTTATIASFASSNLPRLLRSDAFPVLVFLACLASTVAAEKHVASKNGSLNLDSAICSSGSLLVAAAVASATALVRGYCWMMTGSKNAASSPSSSSSSNSTTNATAATAYKSQRPCSFSTKIDEDRAAFQNYSKAKDGFPLVNKDPALIWREDAGLSKLVPLHPTRSSNANGSSNGNGSANGSRNNHKDDPQPLKKYTMQQVAQRSTLAQAWIIMDARVYDITSFIAKHPGGEKVLANMLGKDCTDAFANYHAAAVYKKWLPLYLVGQVTDVPTYAHVEDFRAIRQELLRQGLFETCTAYYNKMYMWYTTLLLASMYLSLKCQSTAAHMAGAVFMGLFWQQMAGWGHDLGHSSVSHNFDADTFLGATLGNAIMGISVGWWKRSHNVHHIVCNSVENDPDIQHMPVFACSSKICETPFWSSYHEKVVHMDAAARFLVRYQHILFFPIMMFARFNLYAQGWILLLTTTNEDAIKVNYRKEELMGLSVFFCWVSALALSMPTYMETIGWMVVSHGFTALLHVQICYSHFSMETYHGNAYNNADDEWYIMQIKTTMNTDCYDFMDWFHIGLQYQIEHHLFPTLPRHNLPIAKVMVEEVCRKHGIYYHERTFYQGILQTLRALRETALEVDSGKYDFKTSTSQIRDLLNAHG